MDTICIMCPIGCNLTVTEKEGVITVKGNSCPRGKRYGEQEFVSPQRMVTTLMLTNSGKTVSVKTDVPVAKNAMFDIIKALKSIAIEDVAEGDVIAENICGSGAKIIVTRGTK